MSGESPVAPTSPAPAAARDELTVRAESWARGARAEKTWEAYERQWTRFESWCDEAGERALPADPLTVARFLADLAPRWRTATPADPPATVVAGQVREREGMRPGTLRGYLAAISVVHQTAQLENPTRSEAVRRTLAGIGRHPAVAPPRRRAAARRDPLLELLRALRPEESSPMPATMLCFWSDGRPHCAPTTSPGSGWTTCTPPSRGCRCSSPAPRPTRPGTAPPSASPPPPGGDRGGGDRGSRRCSTPVPPGFGGATCSVPTASSTAPPGAGSTATAAAPRRRPAPQLDRRDHQTPRRHRRARGRRAVGRPQPAARFRHRGHRRRRPRTRRPTPRPLALPGLHGPLHRRRPHLRPYQPHPLAYLVARVRPPGSSGSRSSN